MSTYTIQQRTGGDTLGDIISPDTVCETFAAGKKGTWLIVAPHDDDAALGCGLLIQAAQAEGIDVHIAVATDGAMGYCDVADKDAIQAIRREEMYASSVKIGIDANHIHWLGLPDGALPLHQGTHTLADGSTGGLAWALTALFRQLAPVLVLAPTSTDYHPDHRVVGSEVDIACFHASGEIWSQLGAPIAIPERWDYAVYCPFPDDPQVQLTTGSALFDNKLDAVADFVSQRQIAALVASCRANGPVEYYQARPFVLYNPALYAGLFTTDAACDDASHENDLS